MGLLVPSPSSLCHCVELEYKRRHVHNTQDGSVPLLGLMVSVSPWQLFPSLCFVLLIAFPHCMSGPIPEDRGQGSEVKDARTKSGNVCAYTFINSKLLGQYHLLASHACSLG